MLFLQKISNDWDIGRDDSYQLRINIQKKKKKPGRLGLFLYNSDGHKYYLVSESTSIYYLVKVISEKYSWRMWQIFLVKHRKKYL